MRPVLTVLCLVLFSCAVHADEERMSPEELEQWFEDDSEQRALAVSEGELRFLPERPTRDDGRPLPHSENRLTLTRSSLEDGWVQLMQCHHGLDAVGAAEVVYSYRRLRNLQVFSVSGIGRAWVEDASVQMTDVARGARLCIRAEVGILYAETDGSYRLRNGPFHRKFFDGYFPYHVSLIVRFADTGLDFQDMTPAPRPGLWLTREKDQLVADAWFEGMLNTEFRFVPATKTPPR